MITEPTSVFVWMWLPDAIDPVVCGRLDQVDGRIGFAYVRSYLDRRDAVAIFDAELPLRRGRQYASSDQTVGVPLCIDDAMPESWGRRLVNHRLGELAAEFGDLTYLTESGSDRIGALDFQVSAVDYVPREATNATLDELATASELIEKGVQLPWQLGAALPRGTSIGGARPKALLDDGALAFNMLCGNTDDHGRNHAAFVGRELELTPAYDICPQARTGETATQAMPYDSRGNTDARLVLLVAAAPLYLLDRRDAQEIVDRLDATVRTEWDAACDLAELTAFERSQLWGRQFLNPHVFET